MDHDAYLALRESAAVIDLTGRGHIQATGEDRARLLHAMTTNHVEGLKPGDCCYAFFLNAQGRILADANIVCTESSLLLDTEPETAEAIYQHLDRYVIADDVTLTNLTGHVAVAGLEGPQAPAVLERMGIHVPEAGRWVEWRTWVVAALSATGGRGFRYFVPMSEHLNAIEWIKGAGALEASRAEWNLVRIENGVARYGEDVTEREIPHETGLVERAISFSKGCYLGQEIVERVRSRGQVNRRLTRLRIAGTEAPAARTKLLLDDKEIGEITSAAYSPTYEAVVALGYVRTQGLAQAGAVFTLAGGGSVSVRG
jgi:tRNA-modifying protein YgfZ